jgi:geranylgeranyl diphosphate synthase, type I
MLNDTFEKKCLDALEDQFLKSQEKNFAKSPMKEMFAYHFSSGGKRIRPLLAFLATEAYANKKGLDKNHLFQLCIPFALAVELIHNATLIHDDIQDGDIVRRGHPTLWKKFSLAQAINCGDAWFFSPMLLVQEMLVPDAVKLALLKILQQKTLAVIEGQSQEFFLKDKFQKGSDISVSQYLQMVEGKTSALFSMPLLGGAVIAGASELEMRALEQSALHLGHAFQIQDDLLDLWGDKGREQVGSDIAEGKLSYPLVLLFSCLAKGNSDRAKVESIIRASREETSAEQIQFVISLMEKNGIKERALKDFEQHLKDAKSSSLWIEVLDYLSSWLEKKVQSF